MLAEALEYVPVGQAAFVVTRAGEAYTKESYANLFADYRKEAGLEWGSLHGLRKTIATRLGEAGASDAEGTGPRAGSPPRSCL